MSGSPPRWAERLLARTLGDDPARDAILGDLREDFHRRVEASGRSRARLWYVREVITLGGARLVGHGARGAVGPRLGQEARAALRSIRRNPAFSIITISVIGLGVGATTTVFSVVRPLLVAPLPVEQPSELVWISNTGEETELSGVTSRARNLIDFRARAESLVGITGFYAFAGRQPWVLDGDGRAERIGATQVAVDFLHVLGIRPALGRDFVESDADIVEIRSMILSDGYWQRAFGGDPGVIGRRVQLNGQSVEIVGVLPRGFDFGSMFAPGRGIDVLLPWEVSLRTDQIGNTMHLVGRLAPGATPERAAEELVSVTAALQEEEPGRWGLGARVEPLSERISRPVRRGLLLLSVAALAVLLVVSVNVANMLLARAPTRARELAVRKALGASRADVVRQLVIESTTLGLAGSVLGAVAAFAVTGFLSNAAGLSVPLLDRVRVDGAALAFAVGVATLTGVMVGLAPAVQASRSREAGLIRSGARSVSSGRTARRLREGLVVAELALVGALLVSGGLLIRSFSEVMSVDLGFDPSQTAVWRVPTSPGLSGEESVLRFNRLADRIDALPTVASAGVVDAVPLGDNRSWSFGVVGDGNPVDGSLNLFPHLVGEGYIETLGVEVLAGRTISRFDDALSAQVLVVNASLAERFFGTPEAAVGQQLQLFTTDPWEIVGVVSDVRHISPEEGAGLEGYMAMAQIPPFMSMDLIARASGSPEAMLASIQSALREFDPAIPAGDFWTLEDALGQVVSTRRFLLQVIGVFGVVGVLLAALGVYGVLAYSVAERRSEISIRLALGATAGEMLRSVLRRTAALAAVGIALGLLGALAASRLLASLLFEVTAADPAVYASAAILLLVVSGVASLIPALRAARVEGVRALQSE